MFLNPMYWFARRVCCLGSIPVFVLPVLVLLEGFSRKPCSAVLWRWGAGCSLARVSLTMARWSWIVGCLSICFQELLCSWSGLYALCTNQEGLDSGPPHIPPPWGPGMASSCLSSWRGSGGFYSRHCKWEQVHCIRQWETFTRVYAHAFTLHLSLTCQGILRYISITPTSQINNLVREVK